MKQFNVGEVYNHTGKEYHVKRRTEKSVWVSSGSEFAKPIRKSIKKGNGGNEQIKIDEYRSLFAGKTNL